MSRLSWWHAIVEMYIHVRELIMWMGQKRTCNNEDIEDTFIDPSNKGTIVLSFYFKALIITSKNIISIGLNNNALCSYVFKDLGLSL